MKMPKRHPYGLSNKKLYSCEMGNLIPAGLMEVLPGDTVQASTTTLVRAKPLVAPPMHQVDMFTQHVFVPTRLCWDNWEDFITGGETGQDNSVHPTITFGGGSGLAVGSLGDYFGIPTGVNDITVSAIPFRAYNLAYNELIRDQDLQTSIANVTTDGDDTTTSTALLNCNWQKDYFTKARPTEQKGDEITIPLGNAARINMAGPAGTNVAVYSDDSSAYRRLNAGQTNTNLSSTAGNEADRLYADLSTATGLTVNDLREYISLQQLQENRMHYGSRFTEYLKFLGVRASDQRLQRPEFLGSGRNPLQFSEVLQTAEGVSTPVGDLKGHGIGVTRSNRWKRSFNEHGFIIAFQFYRPKTMYSQGLHKHWIRTSELDYWQRELEHIGQQEILNKELYAAHSSPDNVFGWGDRYREYREGYDTIAGEFKTTFDHWHFARAFGSEPALNASFVECIPTKEPFADQAGDVLLCQAKHSIQARRIVSRNSRPGLRRL